MIRFTVRLRFLQLRSALRRLRSRGGLFVLGVLVFLLGLALMKAAMQPTPTVQADLAALPGLVLYLLGFLVVFWAVFAPMTPFVSQEETHG